MKKFKFNILLITVIIILTTGAFIGCGGGGGGGTIPATNTPTPVTVSTPTMIPEAESVATPMPSYTPDAKTLELKAQIEKENLGWEPVNNPIAALPEAQFVQMLGSEESKEIQKMASQAEKYVSSGKALPSSFNWQDYLQYPPKDQGCVGTCVAFATTGCLETLIRMNLKDNTKRVNLSSGYLFKYGQYGNGPYPSDSSFWGWWNTGSAGYSQNNGVPPEQYFPYPKEYTNWTSSDPKYLINPTPIEGYDKFLTKITSYKTMNNAGDMKDYIYNNGPILVAFEVYSDFPSVWYATTVYKKTSTAVFRGGHAIYVYGWDDVKGCWLCRNSWGTWGEGGSGNFRIAYGQCGIETRNTVGMTGITHPYNNPDPNPTPTVDPNSTGDLQSIIH